MECPQAYVSDDVEANLDTLTDNMDPLFSFINGDVTFIKCTFSNCYTGEFGAIVQMNDGGTFVDEGSTYHQNSALHGSAVYCEGCDMTMTDSVFTTNIGEFGGSIYLTSTATATFQGIQASDGQAT